MVLFEERVAELFEDLVVLPLFTVEDLREPEVAAEPELLVLPLTVLRDELVDLVEPVIPVEASLEPTALVATVEPEVSASALDEALETAVETPVALREPVVAKEPEVLGAELTAPAPAPATVEPPLRP